MLFHGAASRLWWKNTLFSAQRCAASPREAFDGDFATESALLIDEEINDESHVGELLISFRDRLVTRSSTLLSSTLIVFHAL